MSDRSAIEWHELVVAGSASVGRAFVTGFLAGRGQEGAGLFAADLDLEPESFGERVRELFAAGSHHACFVPAELAVAVADAVRRADPALGLGLERHRTVEAASFAFQIELFAPELARQLRAEIVAAHPAGVRLEDLVEHEELAPEARGVELYAPMHDFVYRASGRFVGGLGEIAALRRRVAGRDFVETGRIHLEAQAIAQ